MSAHPHDPLAEYYRRRATEYDRVYAKPEQQADFARLADWVRGEAAGLRVLEVACGTGHWTAVAAETASIVLATDVNDAVLDIARGRVRRPNVWFQRADARALPTFAPFDAVLAGFWLSHLPRAEAPAFFAAAEAHVDRPGRLLLIDSRWVEGYRKIARADAAGDSWQARTLSDGATFEIVKNFYGRDDVVRLAGGRPVEWLELDYLWAARIELRPAK